MNLSLAKAVDRYLGIAICHVLAAGRSVREMIRPRRELLEPRSILLVKFWGLGNVVLLLPVIRLLRRRYPEARIVFVSLARNRSLLDQCEEIDTRLYVRDDGLVTLVWTLISTLIRARRTRPDLCVDFEQFARASVILAVLAGARQIVGLATPGQSRAALHHKPVPYDDAQHMGQTYLDLARAAGVPQRSYRPEAPRVTVEGVDEAERLLSGVEIPGPLVVFHPGSGDNFQGRRWPVASFSRLADRLVTEEDAVVVVTGTPAEADLTARVISGMEHDSHAIDAAGALGVAGLVALLSRAALLVTNDTAPVHLGSSLGVPVFALFGPNTPRLYGPLSPGSHAFYRALPCSPCLTNMNYKTSLCRMPVCIRDITVDEVAVRIRAHLAERRQLCFTELGDADPGETGAGRTARTA
jgi:ADP-heptose:LPS heptosyltransferase